MRLIFLLNALPFKPWNTVELINGISLCVRLIMKCVHLVLTSVSLCRLECIDLLDQRNPIRELQGLIILC